MWTEVQRTKVRGRKSDESWTEVCGRKFVDIRPTKVGRKSDESSIYVERVKFNRRCGDGGRQCYTAALRNVATMAGNAVARNVVTALAGNALQLAVFLRRYCSNALDLAALLRWPATRRCYDNTLDLATLLRWLATRWTSQQCCDGRQHTGPCSGAAMSGSVLQLRPTLCCSVFVYVFFSLHPTT